MIKLQGKLIRRNEHSGYKSERHWFRLGFAVYELRDLGQITLVSLSPCLHRHEIRYRICSPEL